MADLSRRKFFGVAAGAVAGAAALPAVAAEAEVLPAITGYKGVDVGVGRSATRWTFSSVPIEPEFSSVGQEQLLADLQRRHEKMLAEMAEYYEEALWSEPKRQGLQWSWMSGLARNGDHLLLTYPMVLQSDG